MFREVLPARNLSSSALATTICRSAGCRLIRPRAISLRTEIGERPPRYSQASLSLKAPRSCNRGADLTLSCSCVATICGPPNNSNRRATNPGYSLQDLFCPFARLAHPVVFGDAFRNGVASPYARVVHLPALELLLETLN
jgi:hypothetical protein